MDRRTFIGTGALAGGALVTTGCPKPRAVAITILTGAVAELRILFPNVEALSKIAMLATSFKTAWDAGKFADARTLFVNLDTLVGQTIADLGINATTRVKLILATLGIGVRAVAALIQEQADSQPAIARTATASDPVAADRVRTLADAGVADALLKSSRPK